MLRRTLAAALAAIVLPMLSACPEETPDGSPSGGDGVAADAGDAAGGDGGVVSDTGTILDTAVDDTLPGVDIGGTKDVGGGDVAVLDAAGPDAVADVVTPDAGGDAVVPDAGGDTATPDAGGDAVTPDAGGDADAASDPCVPDPCTVPPAAACLADSVTMVTYGAPATCAANGGEAVCTWAETPLDCSTQGQVCLDGACVDSAPLPQPGEIVITEVMINPHYDLNDNTAEWFEVKNVASATRSLLGCVVSDDTGNTTTLGALELPAGGLALLASSATDNGGITPDALFSFGLGNGGDALTVTCGGQIVDTVSWGGDSTVPVGEAHASALDPAATDATLNDDGANWCLAQTVYYVGTNGPAEDNFGTPGAPNPPCPVPDFTVDWCRLQWPLDAEVLAGTATTVYGRVYDTGITDLTDAVDLDPMLVGEAGYGPDGSDPDGNPEWTWASAGVNALWSASAAGEPGNDEYDATFEAPAPGTWDHAFRFSLDAGETWTYCDRTAGAGSDGSEDGYQIANAGSLVTLSSPCSPNPCTTPPAGTCNGSVAEVYQAPGTCAVDGTEAACEWTMTTIDCAALGGSCLDGACAGVAAAPAVGDVIVTEIMYDPNYDLADATAEWFELTNVSGEARLLSGCTIGDDSGATNAVSAMVLEAGGQALFAKSATANGGLNPDGTFTVALGNSGDSVILTCGGVVIDEVAYSTANGFPVAKARSLSLDPGAFDATANDDGANWCLAQDVYYVGTNGPAEDNYGTPGAPNPACPVPDTTVDWCRLQWPLDAEVLAGTSLTVFGRVYDEGVTDLTDAVDPDGSLVGQAGYGPDGSDPAGNDSWAWVNATGNPTWDAAAAAEPGNDEYQATFPAPGIGAYDHAFRFSLDGGDTWTYCDRAAGAGSDGSEDGYQVANAGSLVTLASPCDPNPCTTPPTAECDDATTLKVYDGPGTCAVDGADAVCTWLESDIDCAATLATCDGGACVGGAVLPVAGEVIITEILFDTNGELLEDKAEWFEVANVSDHAILLGGCTATDASSNKATLGPVVLTPGEHAVMARTLDPAQNGGLDAAATFGFGLNNGGDSITLECDGAVIDAVNYALAGFASATAYSIALDPGAYDATLNDDGANWCLGQEPYYATPDVGGNEHYGSPGDVNPTCPIPDTEVDWCRLQWPLDAEVLAGTDVTVYGRVYDEGITDQTNGVDASPLLVGQAGYGPDGSEPAGNPDWKWATATGNPAWDAATAGEPDNDEYQATLVAPAAGTYDHAFRFSLDGGGSWTYCDRAAGAGSDGSEDGYQVANAGGLVSLPSPCDPNPCTVAPVATCVDGVTLESYSGPGTCTIDGGAAACAFTETLVDCSLTLATCDAGACVGGAVAPAVGEVIVTEIMVDVEGDLSEDKAEWIELHNLTDHPVSLAACTLKDTSTTTTTLQAVIVPAQGQVVVARTLAAATNGGLTPAGTFGFALNNGGDTVTLACDGATIDQVVFGAATGFFIPKAASLSLDPAAYDATLNDDGSHWCPGADVYYTSPAGGNEHKGTPGAANPACPVADTTVDWCRLQWPLDAEVLAGETVEIYGRIYDEGLTDATDGVDGDPALIGQAGYGADGTDPAAGGWTWVTAGGTPGWSGAAAGEPDNDEYVASFAAPSAGTWDHAFRFSLDGGTSWTYCDRAAGVGADGSEDGYQIANAGSLVTLPSPCDPNPCTVAPAPVCKDAATLTTYEAPGSCAVDGVTAVCSWTEVDVDCAATLAACDAGACVGGAVAPQPGDVIVTEIMYDTTADLNENTAEWFELTNTTDHAITLAGCEALDNAPNISTLGPVLLLAGEPVVLARSMDTAVNGGVDAVGTFSFGLNNTGDSITIRCGGVDIDTVDYAAAGFLDPVGQSLSLDPGAYDATLNDDGANWCVGADVYYTQAAGGGEQYGSPGATNPACPVPDTTVDWCRLQWPLDAEVLAGETVDVYGRVFDEGITDLSSGVDLDALLVGQAGYGPDGTDPATGGGWSWVAAVGSPGWDGVVAGEANNDEYVATFPAPSAGTYDHAFRFSLDGGDTWTYCDRAAGAGADGSEDGYQIANAGSLVTLASPCDPNPCTVAPAPVCKDGTTVTVYGAPGTCSVDGVSAVCAWSESEVDCALTGATCHGGACVGGAVAPVAGEVIFTEIMYDTNGDLDETKAEWLEVTSLANHDLTLAGCVLQDTSTTSTTVGPLILAPGATVLFARSADPALNGGLDVAQAFTFALNNANDTVTLTCDGTLIDGVAYDEGAGWGIASSASLSLDPDAYDAALNDDPASWCLGVDTYYTSPVDASVHLGTPGATNPDCVPPDTTVDWCRLQWPLDVEVLAGEAVAVYGRVYDAGVTDLSDGVDVDPLLVGQAGYGPDGSDPATEGSWIWVPAVGTVDWSAATAGEPGNDEYTATFPAPSPGTWDHAFRFSLDGGDTWTYCDRAAGAGSDGSEDGYQTANAGSLVTLASPCDPNPCVAPPSPDCADGITANEYAGPGTCSVVGVSFECAWDVTQIDCSLTNATCDLGVCVGGAVPPVLGEVIFTEIMYDTNGDLDETKAEWLEVTSLANHDITLDGCVLQDASATSATVGPVVLGPLDTLVFARSTDPALNGGLDAFQAFGFGLNNGTDTVTLTCDGTLIDGVAYDVGAGWPVASSASLSLDPDAYDATLNDDPASWCTGVDTYYTSPVDASVHLGTPGALNPDCIPPDTTVDWCRLQWPLDAEVEAASLLTIYGRVGEAGITDQSDGVDLDPALVGAAGYGPDGTDPAGNPEWVWTEASANLDWSGAVAGEPTNDEYQATITAPSAGAWDHAYRFSRDGGATWTYCDRAAGLGSDGSEDGYQIANAGSLVTTSSPCDPNPCLVPPGPDCADAATLNVYAGPGTCAPVAAAFECAWDVTQVDCSLTGATCAAGECIGGAVAPLAGEVIFTEIMYDTNGDLDETKAEWLEVTSLADHDITLAGCVLQDTSTTSMTAAPLILGPLDVAIFARSTDPALNGGLTAAQAFGFALNNANDTVTLTCDGTVIDVVAYDEGAGWPVASSTSLSLDPDAYDATLNDDPASWCTGVDTYYTSPVDASVHLGTPGALNPDCIPPDTTVDWCRLQWPLDVLEPAGTQLTFYGRVYEQGITDTSNGVDTDPKLVGELGYGPDGTDPAAGGWTWSEAVANPDWSATGAGEPGNDEYQAQITLPAAGIYAHAFRFSVDAGATWTYCDRNAGAGSDGSQDGYQIANGGVLIADASPCDPDPCTVPPASVCLDGTTVEQYALPGTCSVVADAAECAWVTSTQDCALTGGTCSAGACVSDALAPVAGEVIVTEMMYNTEGDLAEASAEWFELFNTTTHLITLEGCVLKDQSTTTTTIGPVTIAPLGYAVFARTATPATNGGLTVAGTFSFALNNSGTDGVNLTCGGVAIDSALYGTGFPTGAVAKSIALNPAAYDATSNDAGANWCLASTVYYTSGDGTNAHTGTPGADNDCQ